MNALRSGQAQVLNTHRRGDARDVLGRGDATLQFPSAADVGSVWQRIADGTLRAARLGYRGHRDRATASPARPSALPATPPPVAVAEQVAVSAMVEAVAMLRPR